MTQGNFIGNMTSVVMTVSSTVFNSKGSVWRIDFIYYMKKQILGHRILRQKGCIYSQSWDVLNLYLFHQTHQRHWACRGCHSLSERTEDVFNYGWLQNLVEFFVSIFQAKESVKFWWNMKFLVVNWYIRCLRLYYLVTIDPNLNFYHECLFILFYV